MILFCPDCHRSFVFDDGEVAAKGGPGAFHCDDCQGALTTMEAGLGLGVQLGHAPQKREMTQPDALAIDDEDLMGPDDQPTHLRPSFNPEAGLSAGGAAFGGGDDQPTQLDTPAMAPPRPRLSPRLTGEHDIPADFASSPPRPGGPRPTGAHGAVQRTGAHGAVQRTGALPAIAPNTVAIHGAEATRQAAAMEDAPASRKPLVFVGVGCLLLAGGGLALALIIGAIYMLKSDAGSGPAAHGTDKTPEPTRPNRPRRPSFEDRVLEASSAVPGTAVPAVKLPAIPEDGEVVVVGPSVWHDGKTIASVNLGRVEAGAKPYPESPFVVPLGRSLENAFGDPDPDEVDPAPRWVLVLADGKAPYRAIYEVMYTAANRGARIQLGTTNPMNPNAHLAVEVVPVDWPDAETAEVPESLPPRDPGAMVDTGARAFVVLITEKGYTIRKPEGKAKDAVFIEKLMNSYPVSSLRQEIVRLRTDDPDLRAARIVPTEGTTQFTLVQTISACIEAGDNLPALAQVRLEPPAAGK